MKRRKLKRQPPVQIKPAVPVPKPANLMTAVCVNCKQQFEIRKLEERPFPSAGVGVVEVGFSCPACQAFVRSYLTTAKLKASQRRVESALGEVEAMKRRYQRIASSQRDQGERVIRAMSKLERALAKYQKLRDEHQAAHDELQQIQGPVRHSITVPAGTGEEAVRCR